MKKDTKTSGAVAPSSIPLPNDERTHPLPGAQRRDHGEGSNHGETSTEGRVAGCGDAACSESSFVRPMDHPPSTVPVKSIATDFGSEGSPSTVANSGKFREVIDSPDGTEIQT
jgi:hypothetical protein